MRPLLIRDGHIIDPAQGVDKAGNLLIAEGKILWLGSEGLTPPVPDYDMLDARNLVVCPGFIDLHCHLRQPGFEEKETIATGTLAAARGGFTTVCCMPNTSPPLDNPATIGYVKSLADSEGAVRLLPIGCISKSRQGQEPVNFKELASAGAIGFSDDGNPVMNSRLMRQALQEAEVLGLPVINHCEDTFLTESGIMNEGKLSERLGLKGMPSIAEEIMVTRDLILALITGAHIHIAHVSTAGSVELIRRAKEKSINVTAEVTPHHLTLTEDMVVSQGTNAKVNPPLRTMRDIEALVQGLKDNVIDIIATDHAPHTLADKQQGLDKAPFGISGLETALGSLMSLVHGGELALPVLISKLTRESAKVLGGRSGKLGTLATGAPADITIFDPDIEWLVDSATFASKGRNTPLAGATLKGRVMATISGGKLVYKDSSVRLEEKILNRVNNV